MDAGAEAGLSCRLWSDRSAGMVSPACTISRTSSGRALAFLIPGGESCCSVLHDAPMRRARISIQSVGCTLRIETVAVGFGPKRIEAKVTPRPPYRGVVPPIQRSNSGHTPTDLVDLAPASRPYSDPTLSRGDQEMHEDSTTGTPPR